MIHRARAAFGIGTLALIVTCLASGFASAQVQSQGRRRVADAEGLRGAVQICGEVVGVVHRRPTGGCAHESATPP